MGLDTHDYLLQLDCDRFLLSREDSTLVCVSISEHDRNALRARMVSHSAGSISKALGIRVGRLCVLADSGRAVMYLHEAKGLRCAYHLSDSIEVRECRECGGSLSIIHENTQMFRVEDAWFGEEYCLNCGATKPAITRLIKIKQTECDQRAAQKWGEAWLQNESRGQRE